MLEENENMNANMKKSLKIAAVTATVLLALTAVVYVYACSRSGYDTSGDQQQTSTQGTEPFIQNYLTSSCTNVTAGQLKGMWKMPGNRLKAIYYFLQNATISTVKGTIASEFKGMLILETNSSEVRILLPKDWSVGNDVIDRATLFNGTFATSGANVTISVLESEVFSNANFSINVMIGYEVTNATGTQAYAVLPFNIQPHS